MPERVLIADDDEDNRAIMRRALLQAGYEVSVAKDGAEALERAEKDRPDLILLDLSMPGISGWEAAKRLKDVPHLRHIPVLAFTAHAMSGDDRLAREAGCDGYISKPCVPRLAVAAFAERLARKAGGPA